MRNQLYTLIVLLTFAYPMNAQYFEDAGFPSGPYDYVHCIYYDEETETQYFGGTFVWELQGHWLPRIFMRTQGIIEPMGLGFNWSLEDPNINNGCKIQSVLKYAGEIYVSGRFNYSGSTPLHGVAKWDGAQWSQVGDIDVIPEIRVVRDTLIAIGTFELENIHSICYWNEELETWLPYHDFPNFWLPSNSVNYVSDVIEFQNEVYVGGNFQSAETGVVDLVKWTGNQWLPVNGICGAVSGIIDMEVYDGKLIVAGLFGENYCPLSPGNGIAAFDGTSWDDMQGGMNGQVNYLAIHEEELYGAGLFTAAGLIETDVLAKWNGQEWCGFGSDEGYYFNEPLIGMLNNSNDTLYIMGPFTDIGGEPMGKLVKYTGGQECIISSINQTHPQPQTLALALYPNPSSSVVRIDVSDAQDVREVSVYNSTGQLILHANSSPQELLVAQWAPGCYTVVVRYDNEVVRSRFVVE